MMAKKKAPDAGVQIPQREAYLWVRRNDEESRATAQMDFL
jgi:hypothetical protein